MTPPGPVRRAIATWTGVPDVPAARRWALVAIVDATGTGMFVPVSVLYLTVVVGLPMQSVGVGLGITGLLAAAVSPIAGTLVDRYGAKKMVLACLALASVGYAGYLGVRSWLSFVVVAAVAQIADYMARPSKKVFVTTIVSGADRVPLMAFQRAVRNIGYGFGGLVTAGLLLIGGALGYQIVLAADAVSYLAAAALVLTIPVIGGDGRAATGTPPTATTGHASATTAPSSAGKSSQRHAGYREVLRDRRYVALAAMNVLVLAYATAFTVGMPLWIHKYTSAPTSLVGVLFTLNTILVTLLQVRLTRGYTRVAQTRRLYLRIAAIFALAALAYWAAHRLNVPAAVVAGVLLVAVLAHTVAELYASVVEWTVSVNLAPQRLRGRYLSLFSLSLPVHAAIGPGVVTVLVATVPDLAWFVLAALVALGALTSAWLLRGATDVNDEPADPPDPAATAGPAEAEQPVPMALPAQHTTQATAGPALRPKGARV